VFIQQQITLIFTAQVGGITKRVDLSSVVRAVRVALRFVKMSGWHWRTTETITKFDADLMKQGNYLAALAVTYQGIE